MLSIAHSGKTQNLIIYPQIVAHAIQQGHASAYRLYTLVQHRAKSNQGLQIFSRSDILAYCEALGVMNQAQVDRALREGVGVFWSYSPRHRTYKMISRAKVAAGLNFIGSPGRAVILPAEAFQGRLSDWKATVYAAYLAQLRKVTPSREHLCSVFGVSLPTLLDWERRTGVKATARIVMTVPPAQIEGPADLATTAAASLEIDRCRTARTWISIVSPRGKIIAGRRLMDNRNCPLPDYWDVQNEPGWENGSQAYFTWQTTNEYLSPLNVACTGRRKWLESEIKRISTPVINAPGGTQTRPALDYDTRPGWHEDGYKAVKWQGKRQNRSRPAIVVKRKKGLVVGLWQPSHAALWGEI